MTKLEVTKKQSFNVSREYSFGKTTGGSNWPSAFEKVKLDYFFHDGGSYHIEISPLICRAIWEFLVNHSFFRAVLRKGK